jgi:pimeloyl-ACP methyl ester carboxylesterase
VQAPKTRYARSGEVHIAYQVVGDHPIDLIYVPGFVSNVELGWAEPNRAAFFRRLASFSRLILFDKRGTGLSDRVQGMPHLETRMDDVRAVLDAVESDRTAVVGVSEGGPMSVLFAATYPERVAALILYGSSARVVRGPGYPIGPTPSEAEERAQWFERVWGTDEFVEQLEDDPQLRSWWSTFLRQSMSPGDAWALQRMNNEIDVREVLPTISVPTLILHRTDDDVVDVRHARYLAERIPGARYVELEGSGHPAFSGDSEAVAEQVERFVSHVWAVRPEAGEPERVLATVLFTDIVGSTARAAELGDAGWRDLLRRHHALIRRELAHFRGREIDTSGDGFFAAFDGPARAVTCACAIRDAVGELGIEVRAGIHTGECEWVDGKIAGIAVHIGARVAAEAAPGEVLVSGTVRDLVVGAGLDFADRGSRELKGVPGDWRLFSVKP